MNPILTILAVIAGIILIPVFVLIIVLMIAAFAVAWALGIPFTVKDAKTGRPIGILRWFTFRRYDHNGIAGPFELTRKR